MAVWLQPGLHQTCWEIANEANLDIDVLKAVFDKKPFNRNYAIWKVPKRSGGTRLICAPNEELLIVQRALLATILSELPISDAAHGGIPKRSIITNAAPHADSHSALCLDLSNAFQHMRAGFSQEEDHHVMLGLGISAMKVINRLTELRTAESQQWFLPQGAATSPHLFNWRCSEHLDRRLEKLAANVGGTYTRFVDNITFSMPQATINSRLRLAIYRTVERARHVWINEKKTIYIANGNREGKPLRLPGVNIVEGELRIRPGGVRHYRMMLYCAGMSRDWATYQGLKGHIHPIYGEWPSQLEQVFQRALA